MTAGPIEHSLCRGEAIRHRTQKIVAVPVVAQNTIVIVPSDPPRYEVYTYMYIVPSWSNVRMQ